jgi:hypothetical protein
MCMCVYVQEEDMMERLKNHNCESLTYLINKPPRWNDQVRCCCCAVANKSIGEMQPPLLLRL